MISPASKATWTGYPACASGSSPPPSWPPARSGPPPLGARLAAKEAVLKALGSAYAELGLDAPQGWEYQDIEVTSTPGTPPRLRLTGAAAMAARQAGIGHWHLSLAHDGGMAQAFVVAQADHVDNDDDLTLSSQRSQARTKQQIRSLRPAL